MNVTLARTFLEVVEAGNLNRAAERLNVTQSTVTTRINSLEAELGQRLILRHKSGCELTSAGFKFLRHAEMMLQVWNQARHEVGLPKGFESVCNIGCHIDLWEEAGEAWVDILRRHHGEVALSVWTGDHDQINRWLGSGMIDVALLFEAQPREDLTVRELFQDRLLQVASRARKVMRWDPEYVYVDMGQEFRRRHAEAYPVDETAAVTFGTCRWALDHVLKWGGSGYLPYRLVAGHIEKGQLFPVEGAPEFTRHAYIAADSGRVHEWPWFESALQTLGKHLLDYQ